VTGEHTVAIANLSLLHRDLFDHMLVAQSLVEGIILTSDPLVAQYPAPVQKV
jgi:PIN domain nuclease of toxin-antitoxin system